VRKPTIFAATLLFVFAIGAERAAACTTFCLKGGGEILFGKNYDWMVGDGLLFVNKRGVAKTAVGESAMAANTAKWTSKYGSVTFNQYGRENPSGGMNEAGLVIELMWLDDTQWAAQDERPVVGTLEWIQYQLDSSATVDEVIKNVELVRIASEVKIHYLVNDKAGNSATIEFLNGSLAATRGEQLPVSVLANDTYAKSVSYSKAAARAVSQSSLDRFTRAAKSTREFEAKPKTEQEAVDHAFRTLADVAQTGYTHWSIVYDQKRAKIHFRTKQSPAIKTVDTAAFDYSCGSPVKLFDINSADAGDVTARFADYSRAANRELIERAFTGTPFLKNMPAAFRDIAASYPESFACGVQEPKPESKRAAASSMSILDLTFPVYGLIRQYYS
jgi:choloylglycine hydrolase